MLHSCRRILQALANLLRSWWQIDRIRVSPREGALLRLQPPCLLVIGQLRVTVRGRRQAAAGDYAVIYSCDTDQGPATLRIEPAGRGQEPSILWQTAGGIYRLSPDEVAVYA